MRIWQRRISFIWWLQPRCFVFWLVLMTILLSAALILQILTLVTYDAR